MAITIKVENLSKAYRLGEIGTGTISRDLERWVSRIRGKEDPFLKIGEVNNRAKKGVGDIVWSIRDINFEIEQGDAVGIVGRNGAGKSTLLKILSRVTSPTTGRIIGKGRIASLLEVGTGFHPELTGRENIYLNGAILGMRKREIKHKFDEIVEFAGIERYVDTPVKRYSSGMYVRLAFAVAAHLESEILIVDEVLAVGDAEFQKKCLGKMGEVSKGEGRTVLFVSHNMGSIQKLCKTSIILNDGQLINQGLTYEIVNQYLQLQRNYSVIKKDLDSNYSIVSIHLSPEYIYSLSNISLQIILKSKENRNNLNIVPLIYNEFSQRVAILDLRDQFSGSLNILSGKTISIKVSIKNVPLIEGEYSLGLYLEDNINSRDFLEIYKFDVVPASNTNEITHVQYDTSARGMINLNYKLESYES